MAQPLQAEPGTTPGALLQLMQLASPALPVGGFSYSEGLEAAVEAGLVRDEAQAGDWLVDQLHLSLERADLPAMAGAVPAWQANDLPRIVELNDWVASTRESAELRQQTQQMGRSLAEWLKNRETPDTRVAQLAALRPAPTWPVAFALAAAQSGAPLREALLAFGFGWAENMVQAAMRSRSFACQAGSAPAMAGRSARSRPRWSWSTSQSPAWASSRTRPASTAASRPSE
jgi:urease accessory protein